MTPEWWANKAALKLDEVHPRDFYAKRDAVLAVIREAVAEEREEIKKLVATFLNDGAQTDEGISGDRTATHILHLIDQRADVPAVGGE